MIKKVKNTVPWICVIKDYKVEEIARTFSRKNCKKQNKTNLG